MRIASRAWLYVASLTLLASLLWCSAVRSVSAASVEPALGTSSGLSPSLLGSPLGVEELRALTGSEQLRAYEEVRLHDPEIIRRRESSQVSYEGLSAPAAEKLTGEAFPQVLQAVGGGLPRLPVGLKIERLLGDHAARLRTATGHHVLLDSFAPISVKTPTGRVPVDLSLARAADGAFQPRMPAAGMHVRIPPHLSEGVTLPSIGVSLTPLSGERGAPLHSAAPRIDGGGVFYGDSEDVGAGIRDLSTIVKPVNNGFELFSIVLSARSPKSLSFAVGLPVGASLLRHGRGPIQIVDSGHRIATIPVPFAQDAEGTSVPLSVSLSHNVLTLSVDRSAGQLAYPLIVDPGLKDENVSGAVHPSNWKFCASDDLSCEGHSSAKFKSVGWGGSSGLTLEPVSGYSAGQSVWLQYLTQGESKIYEAWANASGSNPSGNIESYLQLVNSEKIEDTSTISLPPSTGYTKISAKVCPLNAFSECAGLGSGHEKNLVRFEQSASGSGTSFADTLSEGLVYISQEHNPTYGVNKTTATFTGGRENVLYPGSKGWIGPHANTAFEVWAKDPGIGVSYFGISAGSFLVKHAYLEEGLCAGVQCYPSVGYVLPYEASMSNGYDMVEMSDTNATGSFGSGEGAQIKVDGSAPAGLKVLGLPASNTVTQTVHLTVQATDGSGTTPSSGIKSLELGVDGYNLLGGKAGTCEPGPCTANGEWSLNGEEFGAGKHTLELVATDNAGNKEKRTYEFTISHASPIEMGAASVDPTTGSATLQASDVSIGGGFGALGVARSYDSRQLTAGEAGPLGAQWSLSLSGEQGIEEEPTGDVTLIAEDGSATTFTSDGKGGFVSPKGDENLVLTAELEAGKAKAYMLSNPTKGTTLRFIHPTGAGSSNLWVIEKAEGALSKETGEKQIYKWEMLEGVERPTQVIAPAPGVSCEAELKAGCRALSFTYATETKASGEAPSEWGEYKGRLAKVSFTAYDPSSKAMVTTAVAEYAYDKQGRLRAEWDPRISPTLKTTYGYDSEGHVVALSAAGREPLLLHYGTSAGDITPGRLLSEIRPSASTAIGSGSAPVMEAKPTLSTTTPTIGTTLSVSSNGSWSNTPLVYDHQWQRCDSKGEKCSLIAGATNQTYTPRPRDAGYTLLASVTALNANGAGVASTAASSVIALAPPKYSLKFGALGEGVGQLKKPAGAAIDGSGNVWIADHTNNRLAEFTAAGVFVQAVGWGVSNGESKLQVCTSSCRAGLVGTGGGELSSPDGLVISGEDIYVADAGNNRIQELGVKGEFVRSFGSSGTEPGKLKNPFALAIDAFGNVWVADRGNNRVSEFTEAGTYIGSFGALGTGNGQFKEPSGIAFSGESVYVVDSANNRIQQFTSSGTYVTQFGSAGSGNGQFSGAAEIATEPVSGDLLVADSANNRVEEFNPAGSFLTSVGGAGETEGKFKGVEGIAVTSTGNLYAADLNNNRVQELTPGYSTNNPAPAPPSVGTSAVTTVDYEVPVSGTGAPYALGSKEVEAWAQSDDPVQATAVFPPDEPMGWPAQSYKRATISYLDGQGRAVNTASPTGAIATAEYNETDNAVRALSGANRAAALKEGAKSAEVSKLLDTQSTYNAEGTELLETLAPRHVVKLSSGTEVLAREHVRNSYDEGAPSGETYHLLTKRFEGAEYESTEADIRQTNYSYYGQENLGWKLRKPTMVATDPLGLNLRHLTFYDPVSGNVIENRQPSAEFGSWPSGQYLYSSHIATGSAAPSLKAPVDLTTVGGSFLYATDTGDSRIQEYSSTGEYLRQFGTTGTGNGQLKEPHGVALDSGSHVWVADTANNRVQELSFTGEYIRQFGTLGTAAGQFKTPDSIAIDSAGNVWVSDTGNNRLQEFSSTGTFIRQVGTLGTGNGQFKEPHGIAIDTKGNVWVADTANNRVQELSSTGTYMAQFGLVGTGNGQLKAPRGIGFTTKEEIWVADTGNNRVQELSLTGLYIRQFGTVGSNNGQLQTPTAVTVDGSGHVWVADSANNRFQQYSSTGEFLKSAYTPVALKQAASVTVSKENVWVANVESNRIEEFSSSRQYLLGFGTAGTGTTQFKAPRGVAVDAKGNVWVADTGNNRIQEFSAKGEFIRQFGSAGAGNGQFNAPHQIAIDAKEDVWVADSGNNRVQEFSSTGVYVTQFGTSGTGNGQFKGPNGIAIDAKEDIWVADTNNNRIQELNSSGEYLRQFGISGKANGQLKIPANLAIDAAGHIFVSDMGNTRVQEFNSSGEYMLQFGSAGTGEGQFFAVEGIALDPADNVWTTDAGLGAVQKFVPTASSYHSSQTIYYSAGPGPEESVCANHPEWIGLPCRSRPTQQPTKGNPLPVVTDTYNVWDEPETVTEEFGTTVRTKKSFYDSAGRLTGSEVTSSSGSVTALPKVTDEYDPESGVMAKQWTTVGEKTQAITSVYNKLGQLTEYTDADANKTKYAYDIDGRAQEVSDSKGSQIYAYDPTSGGLTKLLDSAAGMFTASYDLEGRITSEGYPNGMSAKYSYDEAGEQTHVEYVKEAHCAGSCPEVWFSEGAAYSIHGEALSRSSTLSGEAYAYDNAGRLTQVQETPAGKGCTTRIYAYDADSNRLSLTTREPGAEGKCATSGGTAESHTYDEADRLSDTGTVYDAFGNTTTLPAAAAEGHEIKSSYYVSNQTRSATQGAKTITYNLDPDARSREIITEEGESKSNAINHYPGPGEAVSWTSEGAEKYTRNIPGIDGTLSAVEQNGLAPILELQDMQGDIVATAALSEAETKPLSTYNSTEFGVPTTSNPPKYSWLGAAGLKTEFASGTATAGGSGYVPRLGRSLQTQPIDPPGVAPEGTWTSGPYSGPGESWTGQSGAAWGAEASAREAARQREAEEAALEAAERAEASMDGGIVDPEYVKSQARKVGNKLLALETWGEASGIVFGLFGLADPVGALVGWIVAQFSEQIVLDWLHETGKKLVVCGNDKWAVICDLSYKSWGNFVDPTTPANVKKCGNVAPHFDASKKWEWVWGGWSCRKLGAPDGYTG
jgi:YD repeat-containing protein